MRVAWETHTVRTADPFRISRGVQTREERVWLRLEADGVEGWGEAAPSSYYGETADAAVASLRTVQPMLETADDPWAIETLERRVAERLADRPAAAVRAAVSSALHDLMGKGLGQPLWRLWGLDRGSAPTSSFTIGIDEPEVVAARALRARGYPVLKVKLGTDRDERILAAVRDAAPDSTLRVDVNGAWTRGEAEARLPMLSDFGVELVEQPLAPDDLEGLRSLRRLSPLPIVLDESCIGAVDVPGLRGAADAVNVKLAKCGGPREALRTIHTARSCGLQVMLGCMIETTLGIAAAAHLSPLADYADLDGAALLAEDPFRGPRLEAGRIVLGEEPGLGVVRAPG